MSPPLIWLIGLLVGFFVLSFEFFLGWASKKAEVAGPLLSALAWLFPLNFLLVWCIGFAVLPGAVMLSRHSRWPRLAFVVAAAAGPLALLTLYWGATLAVPVLSSAYRPFVLGRPLPYYSLMIGDAVVLSVGTTIMALLYMGLVQIGRLLRRRRQP